MMIITQQILERMIAHAEREAPIEACGYLAGRNGRVETDYAMTNVDAREDHFSFDPTEQFAVRREARRAGLQIIGVYHSHPATPARPSEEDIRLAYDPEPVYVIVSLAGMEPAVRAYRIRGGAVEEENLTVIERYGEDL